MRISPISDQSVSVPDLTRRDLLLRSGGGLGAIALAWLLNQEEGNANGLQDKVETRNNKQQNRGLHHKARAKQVVQFFMSGAASQCDTFDYKPELIKNHGKPFNPGGKIELFQSSPGAVMKSPWQWKQYGKSGKWVSDLLPHLATCVDDMAFLPAMKSKSNVHGPATFLQATGFVMPGFPGMGAWVSYGLGRLSDNLPTFVVLPDSRGFAPNGPANWSNGFLPAQHQGTIVRPTAKVPILDLYPPFDSGIDRSIDQQTQELLAKWNLRHQQSREGDSRLSARISSYELAAKMQIAAPEVMDISKEPASVKKEYGLDQKETEEFGRNCLITRRLLQHGVRFVQLWCGADNGFPRRNWDSHENIERDHGIMAKSMDQPIAALLQDLKRLGMLNDTVLHWTTEFGRMPCSQGSLGRDHNPDTFTNWLAGGGIKGGIVHGSSDDWSFRAEDKITTGYDVHATILWLLGIDHTKLTFRHNGIDRRLTDVHGEVIEELFT